MVDDSGSMRDEQNDLAYNFNVFINDFVEKKIDFKMGIVTTDTNRNTITDTTKESLEKLTSEKMTQNKSAFMQDFERLIKVGTRGYPREKGIKASENFTNVIFNNGVAQQKFRDDAYYIVVYVSDEPDQSDKTLENHLSQLTKWKENAGLVKTYAIVNTRHGRSSAQYERYQEMSRMTGGQIADINDDFHVTLKDLGTQIAELADNFPLSKTPYDPTKIEVLVNGIKWDSGWSYNAENNTIKFETIPEAGADIKVNYQVEE